MVRMQAVLAASWMMLAAPAAAEDALLSPLERRWLAFAQPVLAESRARGLPLDVVVQPQPNEGEPPVAMAFVSGRCKLVLTMRGPGDTQAPDVDPELARPFVEAMFAHELAHCWRHARGAWHALPGGFRPMPKDARDTALARGRDEHPATRIEEGFADLVALAWTLQRSPGAYATVHRWLSGVRAGQPPEAIDHDTRVWLALAHDPAVFGRGGSIFERSAPVWQAGLERLEQIEHSKQHGDPSP